MATEKRLIDEFKNEVMQKFIELCRGNDYNKLSLLRIGETIDRIYEKYSTLPTVDVVEVVHGRWRKYTDDRFNGYDNAGRIRYRKVYSYECSNCGRNVAVKSNYCPNCGAKMDGDGNG